MKRRTAILTGIVAGFIVFGGSVHAQNTYEGAAIISSHGYDGCIELSNTTARVVLEPNYGGRVLVYEIDGINALYIDPTQNGYVFGQDNRRVDICAGRFDIGPEIGKPDRRDLWSGSYKAEITGPRKARMTSKEDQSSGVQLIRDFELAKDSSKLLCTQTIRNHSDSTVRYFHWSRTLADGHGIIVVPLTPWGKYPAGYMLYGDNRMLITNPEPHESIDVRDGFLVVSDIPPRRKFAVDSYENWLAYLIPTGVMFIKRFPTYPDRHYGELAGNTISLWYDTTVRCELEPIGPVEVLAPGEKASYTEEWWLLKQDFPENRKAVDVKAVERTVMEETR